jgi:hypothetical protein
MSEGEDPRSERADRFPWESVGRAAEEFARQVARDATRFAERVEQHASELARDLGREWRRPHRREERHGRVHERDEVHRVFEGVRLVIDDVLDGVDQLLERLFPERAPRPKPEEETENERPWSRLVVNRDGVCGRCGEDIAAGEEALARGSDEGLELRCLECGDSDRD